ncbi:hypothetical protein HU200_022219 [Digitaria exilis]|uniref:Uncharacterized protein n=1 Tax=Digitaria exilis TaxID=1010633 RepID=A0A835EYN1_9POAL|nr:hypothetical protein HU200_022219 [Digitaria exilis]CAB3494448.1 unnamed protein product [Digitaria exilis]
MEVPAPGPDARKRKARDAAPAPAPAAAAAASPGDRGNLLLAGLLAHEFLSSGTVLGERRGAEAAAATGGGGAVLVQRGAARVPGVVNPAQLAAWARGR